MKIKIRRITALTIIFTGFSMVGMLAHEAGHLIANNWLGGKGEIFYNYTLTAGHMDWIKLPPDYVWLVFLMGGIFAAAFLFFFFWIPAWLTPSKQDVYLQAAVTGPILGNLFYAPTELILYQQGVKLFEWAVIASTVLASIVFCLLYIAVLVKWAKRNNKS